MNKLKLAEKYYNEGIQIISDEEYDLLQNYVKITNKNYKEKIGEKGKIKLPVKMWSLNKHRDINLITDNCLIMDKLDGVSCLIFNMKAYTRGNGIYGSDITNMINFWPKLAKLPTNFAIRGELVISKKDFNLHNTKYSNCRSYVCSYVNKNQFSKYIKFVAYELININKDHDYTPLKQFQILQNFCETVFFINSNNITTNYLINILDERMKNSDYPIDGLVVSINSENRNAVNLTNNPKYAFAFKKNFKGIISKVINIIWKVGKSGILSPIIIIEPISIEGTIIKRVTGHNYQYIKENKIGINATIEVIRSGHVIPHIIKVHSTSENFQIPNDVEINGINLVLKNINDFRVVKSQLLHFAKILKIKGLGPAKAEQIAKLGYTPILIVQNGIILDCSKKTNLTIVNNIAFALKNCTKEELLIAINYFGHGIGLKNLSFKKNPLSKDALELINNWVNKWCQV